MDAVIGFNSGAIGGAAALMIGMRVGSILFKSVDLPTFGLPTIPTYPDLNCAIVLSSVIVIHVSG